MFTHCMLCHYHSNTALLVTIVKHKFSTRMTTLVKERKSRKDSNLLPWELAKTFPASHSGHIFILHPGAQLNMFSVNICCTLHCALHCTAADLPNARYNFGVIWLKGSTESIFDTDWMGGKSVCSAAGCKSNQTVSNHFLIFYGCFFYLYICAKFNFKVRGPFVTIVCLRSTRKSNHSHTNIWNFEVCGLRRGVVASSSSSRGR